jgi:hypothetical protein
MPGRIGAGNAGIDLSRSRGFEGAQGFSGGGIDGGDHQSTL